MKDELLHEEINHLYIAGKFMIYMQALRFITDYLNNDVYYGAKYPLHNFNRAQNQLRLLECLIEKEDNTILLYNNNMSCIRFHFSHLHLSFKIHHSNQIQVYVFAMLHL